jgi:hypothetical protein
MLGSSSPNVVDWYAGMTIPGSDWLADCGGDELPIKGELIPPPLAVASWQTAPGG